MFIRSKGKYSPKKNLRNGNVEPSELTTIGLEDGENPSYSTFLSKYEKNPLSIIWFGTLNPSYKNSYKRIKIFLL